MKTKKSLTDTSYWDQRRGKIFSRKGGWFVGKGAFCHGYSIMEDLAGEVTFFQVLILNAIGRLVDRRLADWFEARQIGMSWPDSRIWCNQVGALAGTMRTSVTAATVAGVLASESYAYGGVITAIKGVAFIQNALIKHRNGLSARDIVFQECARTGGKPQIMGYARPIAKGDERIAAMERIAEKLGFSVGEHLALAYEIEKVLQEEFEEEMNINAYNSAFLSDQGFTGEEVSRISATLVASGVTACYVDTLERPPESFLPLRCDDIDYQGPPPREVPDKKIR